MSLSVQSPAPTLGASSEDKLRKQRLLHDIRQSLTAVMSLAAVVEKSLDRGPEVLKRLDQMRTEAEWMTRLVSSAAPRATDVRVLDVGDVVAEAWASAASTCSCAIQLVRDARACACVDPDDLQRSVRNLLDNAVRAAGEDGTVVVQVRVEPDTIAVVVRDSGPGFGNIPAQQGLGLTTVRRFAAENAGRLDVEQALLGGAELTLRLPRIIQLPPSFDGGDRCG
jgi:signal transduction histidine kinase